MTGPLHPLYRLTVTVGFTVLLSGCSASIFGNGKDEDLLEAARTRPVNSSCSKMELNRSPLDSKGARALIRCLNAFHAFDPLEKLVTERMSDAQLEAVLSVLNKQILESPSFLAELGQTKSVLEMQGQYETALEVIGKVVLRPELVSQLLGLFRDTPLTLKALEELSPGISPEGVGSVIDSSLSILGSPAFQDFQSKMRDGRPGPSRQDISKALARYFSREGAGRRELLRQTLLHATNGNLFATLDRLVPPSADRAADRRSLETAIPRLSAIPREVLKNDGAIFLGTSRLFRVARQPLSCLQGATSVGDPAEFLLQELAQKQPSEVRDFLERENILNLTAMNTFCTYPAEFGAHYPSIIALSATPAIEPVLELVQAAAPTGLTRLISAFLADSEDLLPVLLAIQAHDAWEDALLVAALPPLENRVSIAQAADALIRPRPALGGGNLLDVLAGSLDEDSEERLAALFSELPSILEDLPDFLHHARTISALTDRHPFIELGKNLLGQASREAAFFSALLSLAETPEFRETLGIFAQMAKKEDGRLKELLDTLLRLFRPGAITQIVASLRDTAAPPLRDWKRHDLRAGDLRPFRGRVPAPPENSACGGIDISRPFFRQLEQFNGCLKEKPGQDALAATLAYLAGEKQTRGDSFLEYPFTLVRKLGFQPAESAELLETWLRWQDDGRFSRLLRALPFWTTLDAPAEPLRLLVTAALPLASRKEDLRNVERFAARVLRDQDFPRLLRYGDNLLSAPVENGESRGASQRYDRKSLLREIESKECVSHPLRQERRLEQIIDDYENAFTGWESLDGKQRRSWAKEEFRALVEPLFDKLSDPAQNSRERPLRRALLNFIRYYPPQYLAEWTRRRAVDVKAIPYYFPGEARPRVRLVNSLDRLELLLVNADLVAEALREGWWFEWKENHSLLFLAELAEAWGDEKDPRKWPLDIQKRFPDGDSPTLKEAVHKIHKDLKFYKRLLGTAKLPKCGSQALVERDDEEAGMILKIKRAFFNIDQLISVLSENLPEAQDPAFRGGLKVFRDLFFEIYYSTPPSSRDSKKGWKNNLSFIVRLVRLGAARQLGRVVGQLEPSDTALDDFFEAMLQSTRSRDVDTIFAELLDRDPDHRLAWAVLDSLLGQEIAFLGSSLVARSQLIEPGLAVASDLLKAHGAFLAAHPEFLSGIMRSDNAARAVRGLYEAPDSEMRRKTETLLGEVLADRALPRSGLALLRAVYETNTARNAWEGYLAAQARIPTLEAYQKLNIQELDLPRAILEFFEELPGASGTSHAAATRLRLGLADRLEDGDLDELLILAERNPAKFYQLLETLGHSAESGELEKFLQLVRRGLRL